MPSTVEALQRYARCRDARLAGGPGATFFVSTVGTRLTYNTVRVVFADWPTRPVLWPGEVPAPSA